MSYLTDRGHLPVKGYCLMDENCHAVIAEGEIFETRGDASAFGMQMLHDIARVSRLRTQIHSNRDHTTAALIDEWGRTLGSFRVMEAT